LSLDQGLPDEPAGAASPTLFDQPEFRLAFGRNKIELTITSISAAHEDALLQLVAEYFDGMQATTEFRPGLVIRPEWEIISARLLYLIAATRSAQASIEDNVIQVHGVSDNPENYQQRLQFLHEVLPDEFELESDVLVLDTHASTDALCVRGFQSIADQSIQFRMSSTEIRESSYATLDRLVEFAYDCRDTNIAIIGHTDSSGPESWNLHVSLARAQAVADLIVSNGIAPGRIVVEGLGSQQPIGDNGTFTGRERNRRIEFELR